MTYVLLDNYPNYEIQTEYPHHIRKIGTVEPISDRSKDTGGYIKVKLNGHAYNLHRIIAEQFIPNDDPEHKTEVDHINHIRTDNHISNLRWVTPSQNQRNKTINHGVEYTYVDYDDEPDDLIYVTDYGIHQFEDYYYSPELNQFYFDTGEALKELHVIIKKSNGLAYISAMDTDNKRVNIYLNKFKRLYDLI